MRADCTCKMCLLVFTCLSFRKALIFCHVTFTNEHLISSSYGRVSTYIMHVFFLVYVAQDLALNKKKKKNISFPTIDVKRAKTRSLKAK